MSQILSRLYAAAIGKSSIPIEVDFCDGTVFRTAADSPVLKIRYKTRAAQLNSIVNHVWGLIESYIRQNVDIEGDIRLLVRAAAESGPTLLENIRRTHTPHPIIRLRNFWHELRFGNHSPSRGVRNALHHYNRGNDMFWRFLDPSMTYTCAYWKTGTRTLAEAQRNKLDHVCRKLRLSPGERLIDVGGGWGGLLFHACENYGVIGTNLSPTTHQNRWIEEKAREKGLSDRIFIQEKDFREISGTFDKYVSLGVFEHAGRRQLRDWVASMAGCLKEGGLGLLHFIAHDRPMDTDFFIRKHIFPGGYLPGLSETIRLMAEYGLEILDIENLRRHYALTLDAWAQNFDRNWDEIAKADPKNYDERFRRTWKAYLNLCAEHFRTENAVLRLYQITFSKGNTTTYPMDRCFLYQNG